MAFRLGHVDDPRAIRPAVADLVHLVHEGHAALSGQDETAGHMMEHRPIGDGLAGHPGRLSVDVAAVCPVVGTWEIAAGRDGQRDGAAGHVVDFLKPDQVHEGLVPVAIVWRQYPLDGHSMYQDGAPCCLSDMVVRDKPSSG